MSETLLKASGLTRRFGGIVAVDGVDFETHAGEVVGIIGPNGSGKTTLFNLLSGFTKASSGTVSWLGRDVTTQGAHKLARSGLVRTFQQAMTFPGLSVRENLATGRLMAPPGDSADVGDVLSFVGLSHVAHTLASDLSWGQSRLLGIALGLMLEPKVLLLDEPFAGLSPAAAEAVADVIQRIRHDGRSVVIVDHEMTYLLPLCDRLVVLVNGSVLVEGVPADVIDLPAVRTAYLGV